MGAPSARVYELSKFWVAQGHQVTVLTGFPNHPTGVVHQDYKNKYWHLFYRETIEGINVSRTWLYPAANKGVVKRCLNYFSFMISAIFSGIFLLKRYDVLIATSPQLLVGLAGYYIARLKKTPFVLEIRDLWPESLSATDVISENSLFFKILNWIATFLYNKANIIVPVTDSFKSIIESRNINPKKIYVIKNGIDVYAFRPSVDGTSIQRKYNPNGNFVISYIGTLGMAHKIDIILEVAEGLKRDDSIKFLLIGEGAEKERLKKIKERRNLSNVIFIDQQPREEIAKFISASDVCLVLLRNTSLFKTVIPSKMFEFMAMGKPIILGVDGEARGILNKAKAGIYIPPEDEESLKKAILKLYHNRELCSKFGINGREFVVKNYNREKQAKYYISVLDKVFLN